MGDGTSTTAKTRDVVSGLKKQSSNHGKAFHQQTVSKNQKVHLRQLSRKTTSKFKQNVSTAPLTLYFIVVFLIHRSFWMINDEYHLSPGEHTTGSMVQHGLKKTKT